MGEVSQALLQLLLLQPLLNFPYENSYTHNFYFFGAWQFKGTLMCMISLLPS